jgi:hypothetical protein
MCPQDTPLIAQSQQMTCLQQADGCACWSSAVIVLSMDCYKPMPKPSKQQCAHATDVRHHVAPWFLTSPELKALYKVTSNGTVSSADTIPVFADDRHHVSAGCGDYFKTAERKAFFFI